MRTPDEIIAEAEAAMDRAQRTLHQAIIDLRESSPTSTVDVGLNPEAACRPAKYAAVEAAAHHVRILHDAMTKKG